MLGYAPPAGKRCGKSDLGPCAAAILSVTQWMAANISPLWLAGRNSLTPEIDKATGENMIYVFALPESIADRERNAAQAAK